MSISSSITPRRRKGAVAAAALLVATFAFSAVGPANAAPTAPSNAAATWLAGLVGSDGAVLSPSSGLPSAGATVQVALGLVANQSDTDAVARAMTYIGSHVDDYVIQSGVDNPGALGNLLQLAASTGADPQSFGADGVDLVARIDALLGVAEPGLYGAADPFSATFNQSLAILGLFVTGQPIPAEALAWLTDQQCGAGTNSEGGWQSYRTPTGGVPDACVASDAASFSGADSNSTAIAVQALVAVGTTAPVSAALDFLALTQTTTGTAAGGFAYYVGAEADPELDRPRDPGARRRRVAATTSVAAGVARDVAAHQRCRRRCPGVAVQRRCGGLHRHLPGRVGPGPAAVPLPPTCPSTPVTPTTPTSTPPAADAADVTPAFTG